MVQPKFIDRLSEDRKVAEIRVGRTNYILGVSTDSENSNVGKHGTYVLCIFDRGFKVLATQRCLTFEVLQPLD